MTETKRMEVSPKLAYFNQFFPDLDDVLKGFIKKNNLPPITEEIETSKGKIISLDDLQSKFIIYSGFDEKSPNYKKNIQPVLGNNGEGYNSTSQLYALEGIINSKKEHLIAIVSTYQFYEEEKIGFFSKRMVKSGEPKGAIERKDISKLFFVIDAPTRF